MGQIIGFLKGLVADLITAGMQVSKKGSNSFLQFLSSLLIETTPGSKRIPGVFCIERVLWFGRYSGFSNFG
jgi:hypothetical protein